MAVQKFIVSSLIGLDKMESKSARVVACRLRFKSCRSTELHVLVEDLVGSIYHLTTYG